MLTAAVDVVRILDLRNRCITYERHGCLQRQIQTTFENVYVHFVL